MDFTNSLPGSWNLVKRNLPTLLGAGAGAVIGAWKAGRKAAARIQEDSQRSRFPTWSVKQRSRNMPRYSAMRIGRRRYPMRRRGTAGRRKGMSQEFRRIVRSTGISNEAVAAATLKFDTYSPTLNQVQTSDLTAIYRLYRLKKVVMHLVPRVDPGNSGVSSNFTAYVGTCCDPESTTAPTALTQISAYDNSYQKWLVSGDRYSYTFYPKVTNSIDISGTATAAGSYSTNPWLRLDSVGITVPHLCLKLGISVGAVSSLTYDVYYDYHFDVKGIA